MTPSAAGRELHAGLHLLDRQMVDCNGRMAGNVDDLELTVGEDPSEPPTVTAILTGPLAIAPRAGLLGRVLRSLLRAVRRGDEGAPASVSFGVVARIGSHVDLTVSREDLENFIAEAWVRDHLISRLPGAKHAPE